MILTDESSTEFLVSYGAKVMYHQMVQEWVGSDCTLCTLTILGNYKDRMKSKCTYSEKVEFNEDGTVYWRVSNSSSQIHLQWIMNMEYQNLGGIMCSL